MLIYLVLFLFLKCVFRIDEFILYFKYVRELQFDEKPDYQYLKDLFKNLAVKLKLYNDFMFDWVFQEKEDKSENEKDTVNLFQKLNIGNNNLNVYQKNENHFSFDNFGDKIFLKSIGINQIIKGEKEFNAKDESEKLK